MKNVIPIYEAKTNLSKLVKKAAAGETIYIGAYGQPQAIIAALPKAPHKLIVGAWKDNMEVMIPDDFDDPNPEIIAMFENSKLFPDGQI